MVAGGLEFVAQEVLSNRVLGTVRITGLRIAEQFGEFGEWSATMRVQPDDPISMFDLTEPWKCRLIALRGDEPVFGLDIWTRERELGSLDVALGGKLTGSWLERVVIGGRNNADLSYTAREQQQIARDLLDKAINEWGYAGIERSPGPSIGTVRFRDKNTWQASDNKPYGEALQDLSELQNGFQFRFEPYQPTEGEYRFRMVTGCPYFVNRQPVVVEYSDDGTGNFSGNLRGLRISESIGSYATDVIVWGKGEGREKLRGKAVNVPLRSGIPALARTESRSDVETQSWLDDEAATILAVSDTPMYPPEIRISANDPMYPLGTYTAGDIVHLQIDPCPELPHGLDGEWRILEYEYDPDNFGEDVILTIGDRE